MSDRDLLCRFKTLKKTVEGREITYFEVMSVTHPLCPEVPKVVRMFCTSNGMVSLNEDSSDTVDYVECTNVDFKGYMPARLMNMVIAAETLKEFQGMHKYLLKVAKTKSWNLGKSNFWQYILIVWSILNNF